MARIAVFVFALLDVTFFPSFLGPIGLLLGVAAVIYYVWKNYGSPSKRS
jgi:hypothetical protein